jgi:hypothetical protein
LKMPKGPKGQKRPADVIGNAVHVMQIATGEAEEPLAPRKRLSLRRVTRPPENPSPDSGAAIAAPDRQARGSSR